MKIIYKSKSKKIKTLVFRNLQHSTTFAENNVNACYVTQKNIFFVIENKLYKNSWIRPLSTLINGTPF